MNHHHHIKPIFAALLCGILASGQAFGITAAENLSGQIEISPLTPMASWPNSSLSNALAPNYTATISVTVVREQQVGEVNYKLSSGPDATTGSSDSNVAWTTSGTTYSITNTAADTASATMTLTCVWSPEVRSGSGQDPGPGVIAGQADAAVQLLDSVVNWDFDRTRQWADGQKEIGYEVTVTDTNGFGLENWTFTEFTATDAHPANPGWEIITVANTAGAPRWTFAANITSSTPSKGKVKMTYNDGSAEERISSVEIAFIKIKLVKVGFSGSGNREISSDNGGTNYTAPHWNDPDGDGTSSDGHAHPVAYISDTKLTILPEWKLEPVVAGVDLKIKVTGPDSISIAEVNTQVSGDKVDLASAAEASANFEKGKVRYWEDDFVLTFEASFRDVNEWVEVGKSNNQFYVTHGTPGFSPLFHTLVDVGCRNSNGQTTEAGIVASIWSDFVAPSSGFPTVLPARPPGMVGPLQSLYYYRTPYNSNVSSTVAKLLADGDGRCGAWARFLQAIIKTHGIRGVEARQVIPSPPPNSGLQGHQIWVKNQDLGPLTASPPGLPVPINGIAGQGSSNPSKSVFDDHGVTTYAGMIYDPSYGKSFENLLEWQRNALDSVSFHDSQQLIFYSNSGQSWQQLVEYGIIEP